jgi:hypothetical protein
VTNPEDEAGAVLFAEHCAGCHTLAAAGTQGSANRSLRVQGPNLDQRAISYEDALFAIHNGGASGAVMPQNIVVGDDATNVAEFLSKYAGSDVVEQPRPTPTGNTEGGTANSEGDSVDSAASSQETTTSSSDSGSQSSGSK